MTWLSEDELIGIRDRAREGQTPDADTVQRLVEQARQLDFVSASIMFQRLHDVNALLKSVLKAKNEVPSDIWNRVKRCSECLDQLHGACVKYADGWPSAHIKW